jgi:CDP-diacylglycerol--glycerol-3-phosphate 3-phosphatidyltransferase
MADHESKDIFSLYMVLCLTRENGCYISHIKMNLPNILTLLRILSVPVLVLILLIRYEGNELISFIIFVLAAITDSLDGLIARKKKQVTVLGKLLDPIADKLLIASVFICFVELDLVPAWIVVIIIAREISITGFRVLASSKGINISASVMGKLKMNSETYTVALLLLGEKYLGSFYIIPQVGLYVIIVTAVVSSLEYFIKFGPKVFSNTLD